MSLSKLLAPFLSAMVLAAAIAAVEAQTRGTDLGVALSPGLCAGRADEGLAHG